MVFFDLNKTSDLKKVVGLICLMAVLVMFGPIAVHMLAVHVECDKISKQTDLDFNDCKDYQIGSNYGKTNKEMLDHYGIKYNENMKNLDTVISPKIPFS